MQSDKKLFEDMAKVAGSAMGVVSGLKKDIEAAVKKQLEQLMQRMDFVSREEFEVVKEMAATARAEQDILRKRLAALEKKPAAKAKPKPVTKKSGKKK